MSISAMGRQLSCCFERASRLSPLRSRTLYSHRHVCIAFAHVVRRDALRPQSVPRGQALRLNPQGYSNRPTTDFVLRRTPILGRVQVRRGEAVRSDRGA